MRDESGQPKRPRWSLTFGDAAENNVPREREVLSPPPEAFPRLGASEEPPPSARISGAWAWVVLLIPVILFCSFMFVPSSDSGAADDSEISDTFALFVVVLWFAPYLAGAVAAFRGSRKGVTWTFPVTCLLALFMLVVPLGGPAGAWIAGFYGFGIAGFGLHLYARQRATPRTAKSEPGGSRFSFG